MAVSPAGNRWHAAVSGALFLSAARLTVVHGRLRGPHVTSMSRPIGYVHAGGLKKKVSCIDTGSPVAYTTHVDSLYMDYWERGMVRTSTDDDLACARAGIGADLDAVLVLNLLRTHSHLSPFIDAGLRRWHLTAAQFNTLLVVRAAGAEGLLMGEIGERLVVTRSNVTGLVDRLERQGLVARGGHRDRRATVVRLTDAGAESLERTVPRHAELLAELTGCLTDQEKQTLIRLLTKLRRKLRRRRGGGK